MIKNFHYNRGFSLIESLVAISILVSVIIGVTSALQTSLASYTYAKNQIIAFNLAQEGVEQIRNIRDKNWLNNDNWLEGIASDSGDPCYFGEVCTVSPVETALAIPCTSGSGNECPPLRQNSTTKFFGYDAGWDATHFVREITLTQINGQEISLAVTVTWPRGEFTAKENLYDWY